MTRGMLECHLRLNIACRLKESVLEFSSLCKVETCIHGNATNMENAGNIFLYNDD